MVNPLTKFVPFLVGEYPKPFLELFDGITHNEQLNGEELKAIMWKAYEFGSRHHEGLAQPARWHNREKRHGRTDRPSDRDTVGFHPLFDAGPGTQAASGGPDQFNPPLHAGNESVGHYLGDRCRRRRPALWPLSSTGGRGTRTT